MNSLPDNQRYRFENWVIYVFDHPEEKGPWCFYGHAPGWDDLPEDLLVNFMTRLFSDPKFLIGQYSPRQIDNALYSIISPSNDYMDALLNDDLDWPPRKTCILSMYTLYEKLFAPLFGNLTSDHLSRTGNLDYISCYSWWDENRVSMYSNVTNKKELVDAVYEVFERTLSLSSDACLESVIHGISLWYEAYPERSDRLLREFLDRNDLSQQIRCYAAEALDGYVT